jgi:hypothetical protein
MLQLPPFVPDYIDAIVAWRGFAFGQLLGSLNEPHVPLLPRRRTEATCRYLQAHECPERFCSCGFYATKDLWDAARETGAAAHHRWADLRRTNDFAIAQVYLWGKVIEFERGYRAQFCYPKTILAEHWRETERLCALYGCEEERVCTWESLFASTELSLSEIRYPCVNPNPPAFLGLSRAPYPTMFGPNLDPPKPPSTSPPKLAANRSHPKLLRQQIAQKEQQAKSDFWKHL